MGALRQQNESDVFAPVWWLTGWMVTDGMVGVLFLRDAGGRVSRRSPLSRSRRPARVVRVLGWCACAVLLVRGISVEVLLLSGAAGRGMGVSPEQRLWRLLLWNPWLLVGGLIFGLAARGSGKWRGRFAVPPDGASGCVK
ncbi:hypothetical protein Sgleb_43980 [Streptomyces glebosus]|uniref:DUF3995 domain-containing protein n=1 Tax=Streptomyces glebosus TaxID=249580 RepID=A0A640T1H3_9ACTN|nr:hypothetical protein Sgleb_43980 [Streptomyces glebosus]GHG64364.1 hypothetical protein GCM10010513_32340 [Streptomyces glebosus]